MDIFWLPRANTNRRDAIDYIAKDSPAAALGQLDRIEEQVDVLADHPNMGRPGRKKGTRELVISRTPFIVVYRTRPRLNRVEILRLLHGAQQYP